MSKADEKPLKEIIKKRNLTLRGLYFKINKEIKINRLSDINVARDSINENEIEILDRYLELIDDEKGSLEDMELDKEIEKDDNLIIELLKLVPNDLKKGQSIIEKCPRCGNKLKISRASINGHLWIVCEKEGVLLRQ